MTVLTDRGKGAGTADRWVGDPGVRWQWWPVTGARHEGGVRWVTSCCLGQSIRITVGARAMGEWFQLVTVY